MKALFSLTLCLIIALGSSAQNAASQDDIPRQLEAVVTEYYKLLSGPAGTRDWQRLRNISSEHAQFNAITYLEDGAPNPLIGTLEDYISNSDAFFQANGFTIKELRRKTQKYGHVAQVFSTYEAEFQFAGQKSPTVQRGVYSFQLVHLNLGWKLLHVQWNEESAFDPIPNEHLPTHLHVKDPPKPEPMPTNPEAPLSKRLYKANEIDLPPRYPGGENALKNYLKQNLNFPESGRIYRLDGTPGVEIQFVVNQTGKLEELQVAGETGTLTSKNLQALANMPDWEPGSNNGKPVRVLYNLTLWLK